MKPAGEITCEEWETLPIEKLVQRTILNMTAKQLELRHLNNTIHYVLNQEHRSERRRSESNPKIVSITRPALLQPHYFDHTDE